MSDAMPETQPVDWRWMRVHRVNLMSAVMVDFCFASEYLESDSFLRLAHELYCLLQKDELRLIHAIQRNKVSKELEYAVLAYRLQNKNELMNWVFQALVLSDAPAAVRRALMSRDELYFEIHAALFFDVVDRLEDETYIWNQAIKIDPRHRLTSASGPAMLLECAYLGGWQRFLTLLAAAVQKYPDHAQPRKWASTPLLSPYFKPNKASKLAAEVIQKRLQPDAGRTVDDLRRLYRSIPINWETTPDHPPSPWNGSQHSRYDGYAQGQRRLPAWLSCR